MHPSLLRQLQADQSAAETALTSSTTDGTEATRAYARRRLNASVPAALETLEQGLSFGLPSDRRASAIAILDRAPATAPSAIASPAGSAALPLEAVKVLATAMASMFSSIRPFEPTAKEAPIEAVQDAETTILPSPDPSGIRVPGLSLAQPSGTLPVPPDDEPWDYPFPGEVSEEELA